MPDDRDRIREDEEDLVGRADEQDDEEEFEDIEEVDDDESDLEA